MIKFPKIKEILNKSKVNILIPGPIFGNIVSGENGYLYVDLVEYCNKFKNLITKILRTDEHYTKFKDVSSLLHASVLYPNELTTNKSSEIDVSYYSINLKETVEVFISEKIYVAVIINSDNIINFRKKLGLSENLNFKGYFVPPHITLLKKC